MTLVIESGMLSVCRLDPGAPWPSPPPGAGIYSLTRTTDELSIVCVQGVEPAGEPSLTVVTTRAGRVAVAAKTATGTEPVAE